MDTYINWDLVGLRLWFLRLLDSVTENERWDEKKKEYVKTQITRKEFAASHGLNDKMIQRYEHGLKASAEYLLIMSFLATTLADSLITINDLLQGQIDLDEAIDEYITRKKTDKAFRKRFGDVWDDSVLKNDKYNEEVMNTYRDFYRTPCFDLSNFEDIESEDIY